MFKNKTLLITGGTGSFGNAVLDRFLSSEIKEIRIFSRDEKKQDDMRKLYNNSKLKFYIGDVVDMKSLDKAMRGVDYVFHAAALKQVPSCEFHPIEAVKTNILGTDNVLTVAIDHGVKRVICLSTDKAVYPINAMGISKAMMEKVMVAASRNLESTPTVICGTRYGNVLASRGSAIPLFMSQISEGRSITITDPNMTRFVMTLEEAVELVVHAFIHGKNGDIFIQKSPAASIGQIVRVLLSQINQKDYPIKIIGTRHGEKSMESLLSQEELSRAVDMGRFYRLPADGRDLNYEKFMEQGDVDITDSNHKQDYNSNNTVQLSDIELSQLLSQLNETVEFISKMRG